MPGTVTSKIVKINQVTRGWINYYALGSMKKVTADVDAHLRTRLRVIIWKQWKVPKKRQWGLQKLGVNKDLARLTSYCGDRYQWVVTKTCVVRAISKEVLAKAGLISCLDYYNERHALKLCWTAVCRTARTGGVRGVDIPPLLDWENSQNIQKGKRIWPVLWWRIW